MRVIIVKIDDDAEEVVLDRLARWKIENNERFEIKYGERTVFEVVKELDSIKPENVTVFEARTKF